MITFEKHMNRYCQEKGFVWNTSGERYHKALAMFKMGIHCNGLHIDYDDFVNWYLYTQRGGYPPHCALLHD